MTQAAFVRWLLKQGLTAIQLKMAAILYAVNGEDCAREFVKNVRQDGLLQQ